MRATWVSSVINLDWPSSSSLTLLDDASRVKRQKEGLAPRQPLNLTGLPEITRQLELNDSLTDVGCCMLFRHMFLREPQTQQVIEYLKARWAAAGCQALEEEK